MSEATLTTTSFGVLRQFARRPSAAETCEMCSKALTPNHQHLLEPATRKLICACEACAILFGSEGETKYKRVPRQIRYLPDFEITDSEWDSLMMPINLAFFFRSTPLNRMVALYPSPAGATESSLDIPLLLEMERDVEALLVNRIGKPEYYLVPIDECFRLVGLIRSRWRGLSGGAEVWKGIAEFFADLRDRSQHA